MSSITDLAKQTDADLLKLIFRTDSIAPDIRTLAMMSDDEIDATQISDARLRPFFLCFAEMARRATRLKLSAKLDTAESVRDHCADMTREEQEILRVFVLDNSLGILHTEDIYRGTQNQIRVRVPEILRPVIAHGGACYAMAHNHPSGDPTPSEADLATTRDLIRLGKELEMPIIDSYVIGGNQVRSIMNILSR